MTAGEPPWATKSGDPYLTEGRMRHTTGNPETGPRYATQLVAGHVTRVVAPPAVVVGWGVAGMRRTDEAEKAWFDEQFADLVEEGDVVDDVAKSRDRTLLQGVGAVAIIGLAALTFYFTALRPEYALASEVATTNAALRDVIGQNTRTWELMLEAHARDVVQHTAIIAQLTTMSDKLTAALAALSERVARNEARIEAMQAERKRTTSSKGKPFPPINPGALAKPPVKGDESRVDSGPHYAAWGHADWRAP